MRAIVVLCINQHTKFQLPSFTNFKDMVGAKFKNYLHTRLTVDSSQLTFLPTSKSRETKTRPNIKNQAR